MKLPGHCKNCFERYKIKIDKKDLDYKNNIKFDKDFYIQDSCDKCNGEIIIRAGEYHVVDPKLVKFKSVDGKILNYKFIDTQPTSGRISLKETSSNSIKETNPDRSDIEKAIDNAKNEEKKVSKIVQIVSAMYVIGIFTSPIITFTDAIKDIYEGTHESVHIDNNEDKERKQNENVIEGSYKILDERQDLLEEKNDSLEQKIEENEKNNDLKENNVGEEN